MFHGVVMDDMKPEEKEAWMRQRIRQLRNQLDEISGGEAIFASPDEKEDGAPLEVELQFLEQVVGFETAAETTWRLKLKEAGYEMPPPDSLDDEAVSLEVWQVIQRLAELQVYLDFTNHLSDRELYLKLYEQLDEPVEDMFMGPGSGYHLELLASGDEEDDRTWLRYFADEQTRERWREEFDVELPPKEDPPYDRDRHLPKQEFPESPELKFARRLAETAWDAEGSPMRLAEDLKAVEVEGLVVYQLARTLLETLGANREIEADVKGDRMPGDFVKEVFEAQPLPAERVTERVTAHSDVQPDFSTDPYYRIYFACGVCRRAGLLRKRDGVFQLTEKGAGLLAAPRAGELYRELFRAGFSKLDLAEFDGIDGWGSLQYGLPVVFLRLWEEGEEWVRMEDASGVYQLPEPYYELGDAYEDEREVALLVWVRLFRWLEDFGLIECLAPAADGEFRGYPAAVRISGFGQRLLDFDRPDYPMCF